MKQIINTIFLILSIFLFTNSDAQKVIRPICDQAINWDYGFSYSGFIIQEPGESSLTQIEGKQVQIFMSNINDVNTTTFTESHVITLDRSGYFNLDIGSINGRDFIIFTNYMNDAENAEYVIEVSLIKPDGTNLIIGSKKLLTIPYALVSNALGGMGSRGLDGAQGPTGAQGPQGINGINGVDGTQGPDGANGRDGFGIMKMRSTPPNNEKFYVDDGTNTSDGMPHILYNNNGTWIEL